LHWRLPNSARNLAEAEFGRIWEKWPNFGFAEAEIRCNPTLLSPTPVHSFPLQVLVGLTPYFKYSCFIALSGEVHLFLRLSSRLSTILLQTHTFKSFYRYPLSIGLGHSLSMFQHHTQQCSTVCINYTYTLVECDKNR